MKKVYKLNSDIYNSIHELKATNDYIKAMKRQDFDYILSLIEGCEFGIEINKNKTINLVDWQYAYLGGVESYENFNTIFDACERLEGSFLFDYYGICV